MKIYKAVKKPIEVKCYQNDKDQYIDTLEGKMFAEKGSWIMEGNHGDTWAIQDEIFRDTYDIVED